MRKSRVEKVKADNLKSSESGSESGSLSDSDSDSENDTKQVASNGEKNRGNAI